LESITLRRQKSKTTTAAGHIELDNSFNVVFEDLKIGFLEKEKPGYLMKIKTGEKGLSTMSTLPPINLILKGEKGKSDPYTLKPSDNKRKLFRENQTDEFILPSKYYIGPVKALQLLSNDQIDKWFIETIIIRDISQGQVHFLSFSSNKKLFLFCRIIPFRYINGLIKKMEQIV
jgi:hypothetical protein